MIKKLFVSFLLFFSISMFSQTIINGYAKVTSIAADVKTLSLSNVSQVAGTGIFTIGQKIIIMQMKGADLTGFMANNANFGNINAIKNTGAYEVAVISNTVTTSGVLTSVVVSAALSKTYDVNNAVQIMTFNDLGSLGNYTTSFNITGKTWDGNTGGIIGVNVFATLTMQNNIIADGLGFVGGGGVYQTSGSDSSQCNYSVFYIDNTDDFYAYKADGIYDNSFINTTNKNTRAPGHAANGGGGGGVDNGGGGGGGNFTAGGQGGHGWTCSIPGAGGLGGAALSGYITNARVFMGGGGGGGQGNNNVQTPGANGGGIILIAANALTVNGSNVISANGASANNSGNDGAGGGGAGGSIVVAVNSSLVTCTSGTLNVTANGGNGGIVNDGTPAGHGAGGGGGQGAIFFSMPTASCFSVTTNNGISGCNSNNSPCPNAAPDPSGTNNAGIFTNNGSNPLPIELASFTAECKNNHIEIDWKTITESNLANLLVEKSADGINFSELCNVKGNGNSSSPKIYSCYDVSPFENTTYYRLKEIDFNGSIQYFKIVSVSTNGCKMSSINQVVVYPNPTQSNQLNINTVTENADDIICDVIDITGKLCKTQNLTLQKGINNYSINLEGLSGGVYLLKIYSNTTNETKNIKFIKGI